MSYNNFPYTDLNSLNLDWIIKKCKEAFSREIPTKTSQLENDSGFGTYTKPEGGIPKSDLSASVQTSLNKADTAYQKPADGIPETDLTAALQVLIRSLAANEFKPYPLSFAAGSLASFSDGADNIPVKDLTVAIEPVQSGTGDPSPDNVRPISGWTGASITISPTADPADGTTFPIAFPTAAGTVYGGTLDVTTGKLTVDRKIVTYNGTENWVIRANGANGYRLYLATTKLNNGDFSDSGANTDFIANIARSVSAAQTWLGTEGISITRKNGFDDIHLFLNQFNSSNGNVAFKSFLAENNLEVCYKLLAPTVYDLTPTEVTTLLGKNIIWADCGPVSAEYRADITQYIDRLTTPDHDMTADTQITSGSYFMVGNDLYMATTVIPAGDRIIPGTNCTKTNLAAALNALNT